MQAKPKSAYYGHGLLNKYTYIIHIRKHTRKINHNV